MVPRVEDDLTDQMLEIKPTKKGSKHVFICIMKMIGYHGIKEHQEIANYYNSKESMAYD